MLKSVRIMSAASMLLAASTYAIAGGFILQLGNPQASAEARAINAAVTLKAAGCVEPEKSTITAHAIGVVNGQRKTVELRVTALKEPGMYAIARDWPQEGEWVLKFVARNRGLTTMTVAAAGPGGVQYKAAKHNASDEDLNTMLNQTLAERASK